MQAKHVILVIFIGFFLDVSSAFGRESKEQRRQHTLNLRRFIQLMEMSVDDHAVDHQLRQSRIDELVKLFPQVKAKLSKKRAEAMDKSFQAYEESLKPLSDHTTKIQKDAFLALRSLTLKFFKVVSTPALVPDEALGLSTYQKFCQSCHGKGGRGDGLFTKNPQQPMIPAPKDFVKQMEAGLRSPFSYFNTLLIGSKGSSMTSYEKSLTFHEMWSVAFFISKYPKYENNDGKYSDFANYPITLQDLAARTNTELLGLFETGARPRKFLFYMRNFASFSKKRPRK